MLIRSIVSGIILLIFFASQFYWLRLAWKMLHRLLPSPRRRRVVASAALLSFAFLFVYNLGFIGRTSPTHMTLQVALLEVPFKLWFFGSLAGFLLVVPVWVAGRVSGPIVEAFRRGRGTGAPGGMTARGNGASVS